MRLTPPFRGTMSADMPSPRNVNLLDQADRPRRRLVLLAAIIVVVTAIAYLPAVNGGFIWDDDNYVTDNVLLHDLDGLKHLWVPGYTKQYYPVVFTTFWMEYQLWELKPLGYHLINLTGHIINALLVWAVFARLKMRGAWMIAAVFALHPVHVESVAWITERKNVLSAMFYLLAMLGYLQCDPRLGGGDRVRHVGAAVGWYVSSLVLFTLALLSKSVTCSLPAALVLLMLYRRVPVTLWRMAALTPMFVLGLLMALNTVQLEKQSVGAVGVDFDFSVVERCLIASKALLFYPWKMLWPGPLIFIYPRWIIDSSSAATYWSVAAVGVIAAAAVVLFVRSRRGPAVALAFYAGTILPALGFINVYPHRFSFVADHFNYLASLGIIALVVGCATLLIRNRAVRFGLAVVVLAVLSLLTWRQGSMYQNNQTLWRWTVDRNPAAWLAQNNLGLIERRAGNLEAAIDHFEAAIAAKPNHHRAWANLALTLQMEGRFDEALQNMLIANEQTVVEFGRPRGQDLYQIGVLLEKLNRIDEAVGYFGRAVEANPQELDAYFRLAVLAVGQGRHADAADHFQNVLHLDPDNVTAHGFLGNHYRDVGRYRDAEAHYRMAARVAGEVKDQFATARNLARFLATCPDDSVRNGVEAVARAEQLNALLSGQDPYTLDILAMAYAEVGRLDDAVATAQRAQQTADAMQLDQLKQEIEQRLMTYRDGRPWRDE